MNVLRQVFTKREYDLDGFPQGKVIRSAYKGFIRRGKVPLIIDAGANAGFASCFFAQVYPDARILAVEPDAANAAICRANTRAIPKIEVIEAALGSRPGHVMLERFKGHSWGTRSHRSETGVPVISIKELRSTVQDSELLIVKVDIEGFELDLFSDNTEWVTEVYAIIVEPHDWLLPGAGSSLTMQRAMLGQERDILISGENLVWVRRS